MIVLVCVMPRVKEFDETEVLDQALELFRARGFKHTSFEDLTRELGVSRQSLYDTYGDKNTLFHAALKRYVDRGAGYLDSVLEDDAPIREVIAKFFDGVITNNCANSSSGCFMVNSMVELAPHDPEIRALAHAHARAFEGRLTTRLAAAQRKGEIARDKDPVALARYLYNTLLGIAVAARTFGERESIKETTALALTVLG
jgi:TetR/AcrR family transcriptional regulator, transcriptional repressor for nem operon